MSNHIFKGILDEKIERFRFGFQQTSKKIFFSEDSEKLIHPGEFGVFRENVWKDFLRSVIPSRLDMQSGFLINSNDKTSKQCDLVIYDRNVTPLIENNDRQRFFPVESVAAIGEVKSNLDKKGLGDALNKLARNKRLKEHITDPIPLTREGQGKFSPNTFYYDNIFSFIICNKFTFDISTLVNELDDLYEQDIQPHQKHNLILSIDDGVLAYTDSFHN